jgi:hypothetical protein
VFDLLNIFRYDGDGRLAEEWIQTDNRSVLRQLGAEGALTPTLAPSAPRDDDEAAYVLSSEATKRTIGFFPVLADGYMIVSPRPPSEDERWSG